MYCSMTPLAGQPIRSAKIAVARNAIHLADTPVTAVEEMDEKKSDQKGVGIALPVEQEMAASILGRLHSQQGRAIVKASFAVT